MVTVAVAIGIIFGVHKSSHRITLQGVVIRQDRDPDKQSPIAGVRITAVSGSAAGVASSDSSGFFSLTLQESFRHRRSVKLRFRREGYHPLELDENIGKLYVIHMQPILIKKPAEADRHPVVFISNVRVRYSVKTTSEVDVGSEVKTLQVANTGNVPCNGNDLCSPDGKWKATIGSEVLDAGPGNQLRNARVSCIAGPCPFTKIENEDPSEDGRVIKLMALDWSDTATFLVEAEVVHPMVSDLVRESYPVIFGQTLSFSLPAMAEGPSIEAEVDGEPIIFPLGPDLYLSWAQCTSRNSNDQNKLYRCELKPGYRFR
jgi:hypothetical protein